MRNYHRFIIILVLAALVLSGCQVFASLQPTETPIPTPTPVPPKILDVCVGYEPDSLYLYGAPSEVAALINQALFDGPVDVMENGIIQPVILERIPTLSDGSALLTPTSISAGDEVVDIFGTPTILQAGTQIFPSGCTVPSCAITWDGVTEVRMDTLSTEFKLVAGIQWSDGETLKASDSVFSFNISDDPATPSSKLTIDQTASYAAVDEFTIHWQAKPGLVTDAIADYFWTPLPEHLLGNYSAEEILTLEVAKRNPVGWGAYVLSEWVSGSHIRLDRNPLYFRTGEGLPNFDTVFFRFVDKEQVGQLSPDQCEVLASSTLDLGNISDFLANPAAGNMSLHSEPSRDLEMLAIGILPASYDDNYYPYGADRPDIFGDARTRQAIAYCIDKATITQKLLQGYVAPAKSILPDNDPSLSDGTLNEYATNPSQAIALLETVGWRDLDLNPSTPVTALQVYNVPPGTPFSINILSSDAPLQGDIAREIAANLANCGIQATVGQLPAAELFRAAPDGPLFGRAFDLALVPMRLPEQFDCRYYTSNEIPGGDNFWLGEVTGGMNFPGYRSAAYDQACAASRSAGLDQNAKSTAINQALEILSGEVPFIPLFHFPRFSAAGNSLCVLDSASSQADLFAHIETLDEGPACP